MKRKGKNARKTRGVRTNSPKRQRTTEVRLTKVVDGKFVSTNEQSKEAAPIATGHGGEMPRRIADVKGRLPFSDAARQSFHNKLPFSKNEIFGVPGPDYYPPVDRATLRIAADVHRALGELLRRIEEQTENLNNAVQSHLERDGKLDPGLEKALPKMRRDAAERDQQAVEALVMLAYRAVGLVEQLPIERLRPVAQQLDEWPVLICRHPGARREIDAILGELDVGADSRLQTMNPKSRWDWRNEGTRCGMFLFLVMPQARFLRSFEFWRDEFREPFTINGLLKAITADGIAVPERMTELEALNWLLRGDRLRERFKWIRLPEEAMHLRRRATSLGENERVRLNRFILETVYPRQCPENPFLALGEFENVERTLGRLCKKNERKWRLYYKRLFDEYYPDAKKIVKLRRLIVSDRGHTTLVKGEWQAKIFDRVWSFLLKMLR